MEHGILDQFVGIALVRMDRCSNPTAAAVVGGQALNVRQL